MAQKGVKKRVKYLKTPKYVNMSVKLYRYPTRSKSRSLEVLICKFSNCIGLRIAPKGAPGSIRVLESAKAELWR